MCSKGDKAKHHKFYKANIARYMKKEIQAVEWLLLGLGLVLLMSGSVYLEMFARLFQIYFFLFTFGMGLWIAIRYLKRYKKKNIVIFHLKKRDDLAVGLFIKSIQLLIIVCLSVFYYQEENLLVFIGISFVYFAIQVGKFGQTKLVFHNPNLFRDAIYFEQLSPRSFMIYDNGIIINDEKKISVLYDDLDVSKFRSEIEFEENQLLDDVLLTDRDNEITRNFINEVNQYAIKLEVPIHRKEGDLPLE